jgi:hypothetical protein
MQIIKKSAISDVHEFVAAENRKRILLGPLATSEEIDRTCNLLQVQFEEFLAGINDIHSTWEGKSSWITAQYNIEVKQLLAAAKESSLEAL